MRQNLNAKHSLPLDVRSLSGFGYHFAMFLWLWFLNRPETLVSITYLILNDPKVSLVFRRLFSVMNALQGAWNELDGLP
ncbi:hypothetical protein NITGR_250019 [Nitrospina gracilis 3/211]|uniref:Transposase n=1 Tax=Nitrospina gracilis (strain 3/211) TaxID=1266370 RepID=M1YWR0_NITG3|nr:hypothetical protein NITGR_250019 [Nitrospina gracilis 3/211]